MLMRLAKRNRRLAKLARRGDSDAAAVLPSLLCAIPDGNVATPSSDSKVEFDGSKAMASFIISTKTKDSYGDVITPEGCLETISRYRSNPVVAFNHDIYSKEPVGSSFDKSGNPGVDVVPGEYVSANVVFHLKTQLSEQVCSLVEAGQLRGASIGLLPEEFTIRKGKKDAIVENEDDSLTIKRKSFSYYDIQKWTLYEWSVVGVPANPDCVRLYLEKGIGGRRLDPVLVRTLSAHLPASRVWSRGVDLKPKTVPVPVPVAPEIVAAAPICAAVDKKIDYDLIRSLTASMAGAAAAAKTAVKEAQKITGKIS